MNRTFVVSDTHFGHANILRYEPEARPFAHIEAHDREIVERWNQTVKPDDAVWHLGDVFFGRDNHEILASLNGYKKLVMGNHDQHGLELYQRYFTKVYGVATIGSCVLTHVPVHPDQLTHRFKLNIHGHMHSARLADPRYRCVSLEQVGLKPARLSYVVSDAFLSR